MLTELSENLGKGLVAGVAGTIAMTVSSTVEAKLRDRGSSSAPASAASTVLGVKPTSDSEQRFASMMHWLYGTSLGTVPAVMATFGLRGKPAIGAYLAVVWGAEQVMLPATGAAPPLTEWGAQEIAIDLWHHLVYVLAAGGTYAWLDREHGS